MHVKVLHCCFMGGMHFFFFISNIYTNSGVGWLLHLLVRFSEMHSLATFWQQASTVTYFDLLCNSATVVFKMASFPMHRPRGAVVIVLFTKKPQVLACVFFPMPGSYCMFLPSLLQVRNELSPCDTLFGFQVNFRNCLGSRIPVGCGSFMPPKNSRIKGTPTISSNC